MFFPVTKVQNNLVKVFIFAALSGMVEYEMCNAIVFVKLASLKLVNKIFVIKVIRISDFYS